MEGAYKSKCDVTHPGTAAPAVSLFEKTYKVHVLQSVAVSKMLPRIILLFLEAFKFCPLIRPDFLLVN